MALSGVWDGRCSWEAKNSVFWPFTALLCDLSRSLNFSEPNASAFHFSHSINYQVVKTQSSSYIPSQKHLTPWLPVPQFLLLVATMPHPSGSHPTHWPPLLTLFLSLPPPLSIFRRWDSLVFTPSLNTGTLENRAGSTFKTHPECDPSPCLLSWSSTHYG